MIKCKSHQLYRFIQIHQKPSHFWICNSNWFSAVKTNVEGTDNVLHAAIEAGVKKVVCLSTDKAAYPINAMGISKAMMEHVIYAACSGCLACSSCRISSCFFSSRLKIRIWPISISLGFIFTLINTAVALCISFIFSRSEINMLFSRCNRIYQNLLNKHKPFISVNYLCQISNML